MDFPSGFSRDANFRRRGRTLNVEILLQNNPWNPPNDDEIFEDFIEDHHTLHYQTSWIFHSQDDYDNDEPPPLLEDHQWQRIRQYHVEQTPLTSQQQQNIAVQRYDIQLQLRNHIHNIMNINNNRLRPIILDYESISNVILSSTTHNIPSNMNTTTTQYLHQYINRRTAFYDNAINVATDHRHLGIPVTLPNTTELQLMDHSPIFHLYRSVSLYASSQNVLRYILHVTNTLMQKCFATLNEWVFPGVYMIRPSLDITGTPNYTMLYLLRSFAVPLFE